MPVIRVKKTGQLYGVAEEARRLGVTKSHLWQVVNKKRVSKKLMKQVDLKEV